jgi:hypothetical protein
MQINLSKLALNGRTYEEFLQQLSEWHEQVNQLARAHNADLINQIRFYTHAPLELLPAANRAEQISRYREIIGFDTVTQELGRQAPAPTAMSSHWTAFKDRLKARLDSGRIDRLESVRAHLSMYESAEGAYGRFLLDPTETNVPVLTQIYRDMNVQFNEYISPVGSGYSGAAEFASESKYLTFGQRSIRRFSEEALLNPLAQVGHSFPLQSGKSFTIFDIETAGLMKGQIREVAYSTGIVGSQTGGAVESILSRPPAFRKGRIGYQDANTGEWLSRTLEEHVQATGGQQYANFLNMDTDNVIDKFTEDIEPFLQKLESSDYIVGHNIANFDIHQIFHQISKSSKYNNLNTTYKERIDKLFNDIISNNKIVDTLDLVKSNTDLEGVDVANEFVRRGELKPFSVENLLLETNLIDYLKEHPNESQAEVIQRLKNTAGLHEGEVDVAITRAIFENHKLRKASISDQSFRNWVVSSKAIVPSTKVGGVSEVSDLSLGKMLRANANVGLDESTLNDPQAIQQIKDIRSRLSNGLIDEKQAAAEARNILSTQSINPFNMNMVEQEILETRNLSVGAGNTLTQSNLIEGLGEFRRFSYDQRATVGRRIKNRLYTSMGYSGGSNVPQDWNAFQGAMGDLGMPWAGLSHEERKLGSAVATATSDLVQNSASAPFASDLLMSHFSAFDPDKIQYYPGKFESGRFTMSTRTLESEGILSQGAALRPSIVRESLKRDAVSVNLLVDLNKQQAENLSSRLVGLVQGGNDLEISRFVLGKNTDTELMEHMINENMISALELDESGKLVPTSQPAMVKSFDRKTQQISAHFKDNFSELKGELEDINQRHIAGMITDSEKDSEIQAIKARLATQLEQGVAVAQASPEHSKTIIQSIADMTSHDAADITDKSMTGIGFHYADTMEGRGIVRTAGVTATIGRDLEGGAAIGFGQIGSQVERTLEASSLIERLDPSLRAMAGGRAAAKTRVSADAATRAFEIMERYGPAAKRGAAGLVTGAVALALYKRHKRNKQFDESFEQMPTERGSNYSIDDQLEIKKQMGINKYYQKYDPLSTANTVQQLNDARIGHTNMSYNRNNALYGGIL